MGVFGADVNPKAVCVFPEHFGKNEALDAMIDAVDATGAAWSMTRLPSRVLPGSSGVSGEALRVLAAGAFPTSVWQSFTDPVLAPVLVR